MRTEGLTVARLGALPRHVSKLVAVAALDLTRLGALLGHVALSTAVAANTGVTTAALGAVAREMAH